MKTIFDAAYVLAIRTLFGGHAPSILISLWLLVNNDKIVINIFVILGKLQITLQTQSGHFAPAYLGGIDVVMANLFLYL